LEHLDKSNFWSTFNWAIDLGKFCKL